MTKWVGEQLFELQLRQQPSSRFVVDRPFNLYGPRKTNPHFLPEVLGRPRANPSATLRLGSLWPRRDLVPVADAARAVVGSLVAAPSGLTMVNIATGMAVPMQQVLDVIGELRGKPLSISTDLRKVRPVERPHLQADASRFKALIGWAPHRDLRRGLAELLALESIKLAGGPAI